MSELDQTSAVAVHDSCDRQRVRPQLLAGRAHLRGQSLRVGSGGHWQRVLTEDAYGKAGRLRARLIEDVLGFEHLQTQHRTRYLADAVHSMLFVATLTEEVGYLDGVIRGQTTERGSGEICAFTDTIVAKVEFWVTAGNTPVTPTTVILPRKSLMKVSIDDMPTPVDPAHVAEPGRPWPYGMLVTATYHTGDAIQFPLGAAGVNRPQQTQVLFQSLLNDLSPSRSAQITPD